MTAEVDQPASAPRCVKGRLSVVVATLNEGDYIAETIDSILDQDWPDIQVHIQDGGSSDRTLEVLRRYPGIRIVSEPDSGVPDAFNRGIRATDGEYVLVIDDPLLPGTARKLIEALDSRPECGFAYGDVEFIDAAGNAYGVLKGRPFDLDDMFWGNHVATQSVVMRREALEAAGLYRTGIINADWDLWLRLGARYQSIYIPGVLARYRVHDRSTTLNNMRPFADSITRVADWALADPVVREQLRRGPDRAWAGSHLTAASLYVYAGDRATAAALWRASLRRWPRAAITRRGLGAAFAIAIGPTLYRRVRNRGRRPG